MRPIKTTRTKIGNPQSPQFIHCPITSRVLVFHSLSELYLSTSILVIVDFSFHEENLPVTGGSSVSIWRNTWSTHSNIFFIHLDYLVFDRVVQFSHFFLSSINLLFQQHMNQTSLSNFSSQISETLTVPGKNYNSKFENKIHTYYRYHILSPAPHGLYLS